MGVVYEAEQVSLGRRVALKVLPRQAGPRPHGAGTVPPRGPRRGPAAPHQHRAGLRGGPGRRDPATTRCSSSGARAWTRSSTSCGGCGGRSPHDRERAGRRRPGPPADGPGGRRRQRGSAGSLEDGPDRALAPAAGSTGRRRSASSRAARPARRSTPSGPRPREPGRLGRDARRGPALDGRVRAPGVPPRASPRSASRWPRPWPTPTPAASSTATSSRPTCCWTPQGVVWVTDFGLAKADERGPDPHRRHPRHAPLHGPGAVPRPGRRAGRRLRAGPDALRAADLAAGVRLARPAGADRADQDTASRRGRGRSTRGSRATWRRSS